MTKLTTILRRLTKNSGFLILLLGSFYLNYIGLLGLPLALVIIMAMIYMSVEAKQAAIERFNNETLSQQNQNVQILDRKLEQIMASNKSTNDALIYLVQLTKK